MDVPSQVVPIYDQPHQFTPLMPIQRVSELMATAREVVEKSLRLVGSCHVDTQRQLQALVRSMNSYYSNRLEGQGTHPMNIEQALQKNFSAKPDVARRQRIAIAHIGAEQALEGKLPPENRVLSHTFLQECHQALYSRLDEADRLSDEGHAVEPGMLRSGNVRVGQHIAPAYASVPAFLELADREYCKTWAMESFLVAVAASHHRLAWVHPFLDGNGRAVRLMTHSALHALSGGLWSVNRALARQHDHYYRLLAEADLGRRNDYDGRGNLSEQMLYHWCEWFIQQCLDQVNFMTKMLDLPSIKDRLQALMIIRKEVDGLPQYRPELVLPLVHILATGPVTRAEFIQMTGLGERTARASVSKLLADGLLKSDSHRAELHIAFPLGMINTLFPNLYPEAATALID